MFVSRKLSSVEREARVPAAVKREGKKTAANMESLTNLEWTNGKSIIS